MQLSLFGKNIFLFSYFEPFGYDNTPNAGTINTHTFTHTHPFNGPLSGTTRVSMNQKGKTNLDFTEPRYSEWQWHHLGFWAIWTRSRQITTPAPHHSLPQPLILPTAAFPFSPSGFTMWISQAVYCYFWAYPFFYFLVFFLFLHFFSCRFRAVD